MFFIQQRVHCIRKQQRYPTPIHVRLFISHYPEVDTYKGNLIVFLGFRFGFAEDVFILEDYSVRDEAVGTLKADVDGFGDFPYF